MWHTVGTDQFCMVVWLRRTWLFELSEGKLCLMYNTTEDNRHHTDIHVHFHDVSQKP